MLIKRIVNKIARECRSLLMGKTPNIKQSENNMLMIDCLPCQNRDAGSNARIASIKLFKEMGYNVYFLPIYSDASKGSIAAMKYLDSLGAITMFKCSHNLKFLSKWWNKNKDKIQTIFYSRPDSERITSVLTGFKDKKTVYDVADIHYIRTQKQYKIDNLPETLAEAQRLEKIEKKIFNDTKTIVSVSKDEEAYLQELLPDKRVFQVPMYYAKTFKTNNYNAKDRDGILFVGGFGHTPNVDAVHYFVNEVMPLLAENVKLYVVGSSCPQSIMDMSSPRVIICGRLSDEDLNAMYDKVKAVVIPLRYGAGVKGKTLESMYNCLPIVCTGVGLEGIQNAYDNNAAYDTPQAMADIINRIYSDDDIANKMSVDSEKLAKQIYSYSAATEQFQKILS